MPERLTIEEKIRILEIAKDSISTRGAVDIKDIVLLYKQFVETITDDAKSSTMDTQNEIEKFREHIERIYQSYPTGCGNSFDEIMCFELHTQPINPRMRHKTYSGGFVPGLTFKELAQKWGISITL